MVKLSLNPEHGQLSSAYEPGLEGAALPLIPPGCSPLLILTQTSLYLSAGSLQPGGPLQAESSLVPVAVSNTMTKSNLGRKGLA